MVRPTFCQTEVATWIGVATWVGVATSAPVDLDCSSTSLASAMQMPLSENLVLTLGMTEECTFGVASTTMGTSLRYTSQNSTLYILRTPGGGNSVGDWQAFEENVLDPWSVRVLHDADLGLVVARVDGSVYPRCRPTGFRSTLTVQVDPDHSVCDLVVSRPIRQGSRLTTFADETVPVNLFDAAPTDWVEVSVGNQVQVGRIWHRYGTEIHRADQNTVTTMGFQGVFLRGSTVARTNVTFDGDSMRIYETAPASTVLAAANYTATIRSPLRPRSFLHLPLTTGTNATWAHARRPEDVPYTPTLHTSSSLDPLDSASVGSNARLSSLQRVLDLIRRRPKATLRAMLVPRSVLSPHSALAEETAHAATFRWLLPLYNVDSVVTRSMEGVATAQTNTTVVPRCGRVGCAMILNTCTGETVGIGSGSATHIDAYGPESKATISTRFPRATDTVFRGMHRLSPFRGGRVYTSASFETGTIQIFSASAYLGDVRFSFGSVHNQTSRVVVQSASMTPRHGTSIRVRVAVCSPAEIQHNTFRMQPYIPEQVSDETTASTTATTTASTTPSTTATTTATSTVTSTVTTTVTTTATPASSSASTGSTPDPTITSAAPTPSSTFTTSVSELSVAGFGGVLHPPAGSVFDSATLTHTNNFVEMLGKRVATERRSGTDTEFRQAACDTDVEVASYVAVIHKHNVSGIVTGVSAVNTSVAGAETTFTVTAPLNRQVRAATFHAPASTVPLTALVVGTDGRVFTMGVFGSNAVWKPTRFNTVASLSKAPEIGLVTLVSAAAAASNPIPATAAGTATTFVSSTTTFVSSTSTFAAPTSTSGAFGTSIVVVDMDTTPDCTDEPCVSPLASQMFSEHGRAQGFDSGTTDVHLGTYSAHSVVHGAGGVYHMYPTQAGWKYGPTFVELYKRTVPLGSGHHVDRYYRSTAPVCNEACSGWIGTYGAAAGDASRHSGRVDGMNEPCRIDQDDSGSGCTTAAPVSVDDTTDSGVFVNSADNVIQARDPAIRSGLATIRGVRYGDGTTDGSGSSWHPSGVGSGSGSGSSGSLLLRSLVLWSSALFDRFVPPRTVVSQRASRLGLSQFDAGVPFQLTTGMYDGCVLNNLSYALCGPPRRCLVAAACNLVTSAVGLQTVTVRRSDLGSVFNESREPLVPYEYRDASGQLKRGRQCLRGIERIEREATATAPAECRLLTVCGPQEYECTSPTLRRDRQCCVVKSCSGDSYVLQGPTRTSDAVCQRRTTGCPHGKRYVHASNAGFGERVGQGSGLGGFLECQPVPCNETTFSDFEAVPDVVHLRTTTRPVAALGVACSPGFYFDGDAFVKNCEGSVVPRRFCFQCTECRSTTVAECTNDTDTKCEGVVEATTVRMGSAARGSKASYMASGFETGGHLATVAAVDDSTLCLPAYYLDVPQDEGLALCKKRRVCETYKSKGRARENDVCADVPSLRFYSVYVATLMGLWGFSMTAWRSRLLVFGTSP